MYFFDGREITPFQFTCLAFAASIVAGMAAWLLFAPARRWGLVSRHRRDRFGSGATPLVGGPALLIGVLGPLLVLGMPLSAGQAVAAAGFFAVGLLDDLKELKPPVKFALQGAVALSAATLLMPTPAYAGFGALVFLLLVNACNYLDNMDGVLSGVALTQAVTLLLWGILACTGAPLLAWGLPAILFFSLPPARLYLGDSGSHLVGALLALDAIHYLSSDGELHPRYLIPFVVLFAVQIVDVATVTVSRIRRGRPPFRGGTDHLSHRLVRVGFSVPQAVFVLVLASGVCGVASLFLVHSS